MKLILKCDIPVVFYKFNMYSVQLAVKTQLIYCTVCTMYKNYMRSHHLCDIFAYRTSHSLGYTKTLKMAKIGRNMQFYTLQKQYNKFSCVLTANCTLYILKNEISVRIKQYCLMFSLVCTRVGTLIVATIYLQLIQNRYKFRSFTVLQCSHQHCEQPVASDVEVVGYLQQRLLC